MTDHSTSFDEYVDEIGSLLREGSTDLRLTNIENAWPGLVGKDLAEWTSPLAFDKNRGYLAVGVANSIWLDEIEQTRESLRRQIGRWLPIELEELDFQIDKTLQPEKSSDQKQTKRQMEPPISIPGNMEEALSKLDDEARELAERIYGRIANRRR